MHEVMSIPRDVKLVVLPGDNDIGGEGAEGMVEHINQ